MKNASSTTLIGRMLRLHKVEKRGTSAIGFMDIPFSTDITMHISHTVETACERYIELFNGIE